MRFEPGRVVLRRYYTRDSSPAVVGYGRVVSDDDRGLLLWVAEGSPMRWLEASDGRSPQDMPFPEWISVPKRRAARTWEGSGVLMLIPPQSAYSVWWFWRGDHGSFSAWYVNLELPPVRWDDGSLAGIDSVDQDLDIVVAYPDRRWRYKDADVLAERSAHPEHYWVDDPAAVQAEGERVAAMVEAGAFPFDGTWCDFRPDPAWAVPAELPAGWDRPRVYQETRP